MRDVVYPYVNFEAVCHFVLVNLRLNVFWWFTALCVLCILVNRDREIEIEMEK
jgi:hypothetical protein